MRRTELLQEVRKMRFEEACGGWQERRPTQEEAARMPSDEGMRTEAPYRERYEGWNVKHFHGFYRREHGGRRGCTWVKRTLRRAGLVAKAPGRGKHRRRLSRPRRGAVPRAAAGREGSAVG